MHWRIWWLTHKCSTVVFLLGICAKSGWTTTIATTSPMLQRLISFILSLTLLHFGLTVSYLYKKAYYDFRSSL